MSDITITPPSIIGLSVTAPNVLALQVIAKEPVVLTVGDVTIGAVELAGDCTGPSGANTVVKIRGQTVQSGTPARLQDYPSFRSWPLQMILLGSP